MIPGSKKYKLTEIVKSKFLMIGLFFISVMCAYSEIIINYQGKISDSNGMPFNAQGHFKFAMLNESGTEIFWSNDGSITGAAAGTEEPSAHISLNVVNGVFSIPLGKSGVTDLIPETIVNNSPLYLRIWFSETTSGFKKFDSDLLITPSLISYYSDNAGMLNGKKSTDFALSTHKHSFTQIEGTLTDAQVPDNITVLNASKISGYSVSLIPSPGTILPLNVNGKFPVSVISAPLLPIIIATSGGSFTSIEEAVEFYQSSASDNSPWSFQIHPGKYSEKSITGVSNISLIGIDRDSTVVSFDNSTTQTFFKSKQSIENITFNISSTGKGILITGIDSPEFYNCKFTGSTYSRMLEIKESASPVFRDCYFNSQTSSACTITSGTAEFYNCTFISNTSDAVLINGPGADVKFNNCRFESSQKSGILIQSGKVELIGCEASSGGVGGTAALRAENGDVETLSSTFTGKGTATYGLICSGDADVNISGSIIVSKKYRGVLLEQNSVFYITGSDIISENNLPALYLKSNTVVPRILNSRLKTTAYTIDANEAKDIYMALCIISNSASSLITNKITTPNNIQSGSF